MVAEERSSVGVYIRYPIMSIVVYNGVTIVHYILGAAGIIVGYQMSTVASTAGFMYFLFACIQMYLIMSLTVCPHCVYYRMKEGRCVSALNILSKFITKKGNTDMFVNRSKGLLSHNTMYISALVLPVIALIPALVINFSPTPIFLEIIIIGLLLYRIFGIFGSIACAYCMTKMKCPNFKG